MGKAQTELVSAGFSAIFSIYFGVERGGAGMQRVEADMAVSVSDLKKNPTAIMDGAGGGTIAVLNHNRIMAYMVPASTYEALIDALDDQTLVEIAKARAGERGVPVSLDDL
jgi:antitoxin StbD